ncbi:MAG: hypothetical protein CM1200mP41_03040 [Gammaproteobacteria bacterium]|nr:MAG: hypothetical protein CM1200mP41_03040 [Gammaproteobacteria bacterium]
MRVSIDNVVLLEPATEARVEGHFGDRGWGDSQKSRLLQATTRTFELTGAERRSSQG